MQTVNRMSLMVLITALQASIAYSQEALPRRSGSIVLKVQTFDVARQSVLDIAEKEGAILLDARTLVNEKGHKNGWLRIQMPVDKQNALIEAIHGVGKLYGEKLAVADHRSEYESLDRRAVKLREHEQRLDSILRSNKRLRGSDILYVQERLFRAGVDEAMLMQRRSDLERSGRSATLVVTLFEPGASPVVDQSKADPAGWWQRANRHVKGEVNELLLRATFGGAYALYFAPLWIPALFLLWVLIRKARPHVRRLIDDSRAIVRAIIRWWHARHATPNPPATK